MRARTGPGGDAGERVGPVPYRLTLLAQPVQLAEIATAAMWQARRGEASSPQKDFRSPKDKALFNGKQINSQLVT